MNFVKVFLLFCFYIIVALHFTNFLPLYGVLFKVCLKFVPSCLWKILLKYFRYHLLLGKSVALYLKKLGFLLPKCMCFVPCLVEISPMEKISVEILSMCFYYFATNAAWKRARSFI